MGETDKNDVYNGLGKEFDKDGLLIKEGYYKNGVLSGNWCRIQFRAILIPLSFCVQISHDKHRHSLSILYSKLYYFAY